MSHAQRTITQLQEDNDHLRETIDQIGDILKAPNVRGAPVTAEQLRTAVLEALNQYVRGCTATQENCDLYRALAQATATTQEGASD